MAALAILADWIPRVAALEDVRLATDSALLAAIGLLLCAAWPRAGWRTGDSGSRARTASGILVGVAGLIVMARAGQALLPTVFAGRIDVARGDMLVVIEAGIERLLHNQNPYVRYHVPWEVPLPYGPWLWMPYIVPYVLHVDPRVLTLVAFLTVAAAVIFAGGVAVARGHAAIGLLLLGLAAMLALHPSIAQFYGIGHTMVYWPLLLLFCVMLRRERWTAIALLTGCLIPARTTMVSFVPIVLLHLYYRGELTLRRVAILTAAAVLPFVPFAIVDWRGLAYDVVASYPAIVKHSVWPATDWAHQTLGVTGLLLRHGWQRYVEVAQGVAMAVVYGLAWLAIRRGARPEPWLALALLTFAMTSLWPLIYLYFDVYVFLACALASEIVVFLAPSLGAGRYLAVSVAAALAVVLVMAAVRPGASFTIDVGTPAAEALTGAGFGQDEVVVEDGRTFVWVEGDVARIRLPRAGWFGTTIRVTLKPYGPGGGPRQHVSALLNDRPIGVADVDDGWSDAVFYAPQRAWFYGLNVLELRFGHAVSAALLGNGSDTRQLSVAVDAISVGR